MSTVPTDIIFQILSYSDPRDIIQWRTVSKVFNAITNKTALWKATYKNVPFPRPPANSLSTKSVTSLERTLVKAARLEKSWTTRPMRALSSLVINIDRGDKLQTPPKLLSGRWFVTFGSRERFVLHDVDPATHNHTQQVLWRQPGPDGPRVSSWHVESILSPEGHCMMYLLLSFHGLSGCKLYEFRLDHNTGKRHGLPLIDIPRAERESGNKSLHTGNSQLLLISISPKDQMVLDTRTHVFYKVPLSYEGPSRIDWIVFSDSIISLHRLDNMTAVHVFTLPPDGAGGKTSLRTLSLTHEGIIDTRLFHVKLMKPAVDLTTGATNIKLIDCSAYLDPLQLTYVEMTLSHCSLGVVLPINAKTRNIMLPREGVRLRRYPNYCQYTDVFDDGQIRGFFRAGRASRPWNFDENRTVMKFSIDTTQDPWVVTRGPSVPAEWNNEMDGKVDISGEDIFFDGMRGRLCYSHQVAGQDIVVVMDIE